MIRVFERHRVPASQRRCLSAADPGRPAIRTVKLRSMVGPTAGRPSGHPGAPNPGSSRRFEPVSRPSTRLGGVRGNRHPQAPLGGALPHQPTRSRLNRGFGPLQAGQRHVDLPARVRPGRPAPAPAGRLQRADRTAGEAPDHRRRQASTRRGVPSLGRVPDRRADRSLSFAVTRRANRSASASPVERVLVQHIRTPLNATSFTRDGGVAVWIGCRSSTAHLKHCGAGG